jgi:ABC-type multidrug transport system fused ATPase/permease subunit
MGNDCENIFLALYQTLSVGFFGILLIIETIIVMFIFNQILATIVVILTPLSLFVSAFFNKKIYESHYANANKSEIISNISLEYFKNIKLFKVLNYEEKQKQKFLKENKELLKVDLKSQWYGSLINPSVRVVNNLVYVITGIVGIILINNELLTVGLLLMFLLFANQYTKPFNDISILAGDIFTAISSYKRIKEVLELPDIKKALKTRESLTGKIITKDLCVGYNDINILKNINFEIEKGEHIAIVGITGAGKTTFVKALMKFIYPTEGLLCLDDEDILELKEETIRSNITMVLQNSYVFNKTYYENITFGNENVSLDLLNEVLIKSGLDKIIEKFEKGINTKIENTSSLSIGEKQLICVTRAFLNPKKILILDEATSSIDIMSERKIQELFKEMMKDKTTIIIAHRLSTIKDVDRIFVIDKGVVIEEGKHSELLENNGLYSSLYKR